VVEHPGVTVEVTTFEAWPGGDRSFDLALAAQSFHWIDPAVRYTKAARVARSLAVLTNERAPLRTPLRAEIDDAYTNWTPGGDGTDHVQRAVEIARETWTKEIDASGLYGPVHLGLFPWERTYTSREYVRLLDTYSDHRTLPDPQRLGLYAAIGSAIDRHGGTITIPYVSMAFVASVR
jgi:hypothetical protein